MDLDCENFAGTIRPDDICLADEIQTEVNMGTDHVYKEGEKIRLYLPKDKLILVRK